MSYRPQATISVDNALKADGSDLSIKLIFESMSDFSPEVVAGKIPELRALMASRNLLRDLKSNLLDNATFRRELEAILRDPSLSGRLSQDLKQIGGSALSISQ